MRLALGTVQFGLEYGISNTIGMPSFSTVSQIMLRAHELGISLLDTAYGYGTSEERIGKVSENRKYFDIVSKFPPVKDTSFEVNVYLKKSLNRLNLSCLYGYLSHDADCLIKFPGLWDQLLKCKEDRLVKKIGFSIYTPSQLEQLLSNGCVPDLVQLPFNVFDRRFQPYLSDLKAKGVEIHTRSCFLQGLFFMQKSELPEKLLVLSPYLDALNRVAVENNLDIATIAMGYCYSNISIDRIVIGVNTVDELEENVRLSDMSSFVSNKIVETINETILVKEENLLMPSNW